MGFFSNLFNFMKQDKSQDSEVSKIIEYINLFAEASFFMVSEELIKKDDNSMKTSMYFFGAIDAVCQNNNISETTAIGILTSFIMRHFNLSVEDTGTIVTVLMNNTVEGKYLDYMSSGGSAIVAWSNGDSFAPMELYNILKNKI